MNIQDNQVWCHSHMCWVDIDTETLILNDVDIVCQRCYPERYIHLGYAWDVAKWNDLNHKSPGD